MPRPTIVAVVPCYNTSAACIEVIAQASAFADMVLAVDDGSTDDTAEHLRSTGCVVLRLPENRGKGAALAAGFRAVLAGMDGRLHVPADAVITIDGDGQHVPSDIPRLVAGAAATGADLVLGMRDPDEMPRRSRIGSHFSRLLFVIGTATFVADTQSGFRLLSRRLLVDLIDRVTWQGYESESELLWKALARGYTVAAVGVSTIYIDGNRASQFEAWRDSLRIAAVFAREISWTVGTAALDLAAYGTIVAAGWLPPATANVASRVIAVAAQATLREDFAARTARLMRQEGAASCVAAFGGHMAVTTALVALLSGGGVPALPAKMIAQLAGYLGTFAVVDRVLLRRVRTTGQAWGPAGPGSIPARR
jgi:hypothetical protein